MERGMGAAHAAMPRQHRVLMGGPHHVLSTRRPQQSNRSVNRSGKRHFFPQVKPPYASPCISLAPLRLRVIIESLHQNLSHDQTLLAQSIRCTVEMRPSSMSYLTGQGQCLLEAMGGTQPMHMGGIQGQCMVRCSRRWVKAREGMSMNWEGTRQEATTRVLCRRSSVSRPGELFR